MVSQEIPVEGFVGHNTDDLAIVVKEGATTSIKNELDQIVDICKSSFPDPFLSVLWGAEVELECGNNEGSPKRRNPRTVVAEDGAGHLAECVLIADFAI